MKTVKIYDDSDIDLLLKADAVSDEPCHLCYAKTDCCCGCPEQREYEAAIKPYKDANIYSDFLQIRELRALQKEVKSAQKEIVKILGEYAEVPALYNALVRDNYL